MQDKIKGIEVLNAVKNLVNLAKEQGETVSVELRDNRYSWIMGEYDIDPDSVLIDFETPRLEFDGLMIPFDWYRDLSDWSGMIVEDTPDRVEALEIYYSEFTNLYYYIYIGA